MTETLGFICDSEVGAVSGMTKPATPEASCQDTNEMTWSHSPFFVEAVQYQFLVIGEAVRHIDTDILDKYNYPWHIPRSFRNFIIHVYHGVKMERIYYATQDLDELEKQVKRILKNEF